LTGTGYSGGRGNILKLPVPQIAEQRILASPVAEIQVAKTIAIEVPRRHSASTHEIVAFSYALRRHNVCPEDAGFPGRKEGESGFA